MASCLEHSALEQGPVQYLAAQLVLGMWSAWGTPVATGEAGPAESKSVLGNTFLPTYNQSTQSHPLHNTLTPIGRESITEKEHGAQGALGLPCVQITWAPSSQRTSMAIKGKTPHLCLEGFLVLPAVRSPGPRVKECVAGSGKGQHHSGCWEDSLPASGLST